MKKIVTIALIPFLICCKENTTVKNSEAESKIIIGTEIIECESYEIIRQLNNLPSGTNIAEWLNQNGGPICEQELYECLPPSHEISEDCYWTAVKAHSENRGFRKIKKYSVRWRDVYAALQGIDCYDYYLGFTFDSNGVNFKKVSFTTNESCYSKPFLLGVKSINDLRDDDYLIFNRALETNGKEKVYFRSRDRFGNENFYDISDNPKLVCPQSKK